VIQKVQILSTKLCCYWFFILNRINGDGVCKNKLENTKEVITSR
jgi:hypothetical protein